MRDLPSTIRGYFGSRTDLIFTSIPLRRQQGLLTAFSRPREAVIRNILRDRSPTQIAQFLRPGMTGAAA